jgi:hypothetical protein
VACAYSWAESWAPAKRVDLPLKRFGWTAGFRGKETIEANDSHMRAAVRPRFGAVFRLEPQVGGRCDEHNAGQE